MVYTTMRGRRSDSEEDENLLGSNLGKQKDIPETEYRQLGLQDNTDVVGLAISQLSHLLSQSRQNFHVDDDDGVPGSTAGSNNFQVQRWVDSLSDAYLSPNMHPHMLRAQRLHPQKKTLRVKEWIFPILHQSTLRQRKLVKLSPQKLNILKLHPLGDYNCIHPLDLNLSPCQPFFSHGRL